MQHVPVSGNGKMQADVPREIGECSEHFMFSKCLSVYCTWSREWLPVGPETVVVDPLFLSAPGQLEMMFSRESGRLSGWRTQRSGCTYCTLLGHSTF